MANIFEKEEDKRGGGVTGTQAPTLTQQQAVTSQGGGVGQQKGPASSGRFTGVQKFIRANRPGEFAQQTAEKVTGRAEGVKSQLGQSQQQFKQKIEPVKSAVQSGQTAVSAFGSSGGNIIDPQLTSAIEGISGPEVVGLSGAGNLKTSAANVSQLASGLAGKDRQSALRQLYARPDYSSGQQRLDSLLLGRDPRALMQARAKTAALQGLVGQSVGLAEQEASGLGQAATDVTTQAREQFENVYGKRMGEAKQRADELNAQRQAEFNDIRDTINRGGQLSPDQLAKLGIGAGETFLTPDEVTSFLRTNENFNVDVNEAIDQNMKDYLHKLSSAAGKYQGGSTSQLNKMLAGPLGSALQDRGYGFAASDYEAANRAAQQRYLDEESALNAARNLAESKRAQYEANEAVALPQSGIPQIGREATQIALNEAIKQARLAEWQESQKQFEAAQQGFGSRWGSVRRTLGR